jgi:hypothetical protein
MDIRSHNARKDQRLSDRRGSAKARLLQARIRSSVWQPVRRKKMLSIKRLRLF